MKKIRKQLMKVGDMKNLVDEFEIHSNYNLVNLLYYVN